MWQSCHRQPKLIYEYIIQKQQSQTESEKELGNDRFEGGEKSKWWATTHDKNVYLSAVSHCSYSDPELVWSSLHFLFSHGWYILQLAHFTGHKFLTEV